jgi:hypothetical protein
MACAIILGGYSSRNVDMFGLSHEFWIGTIIALVILLLGVGVTIAMDSKTRGEYRFASGCFITSATIAVYGIVRLQMSIKWPAGARIATTYLLFALVIALAGEAVRWAKKRHEKPRPDNGVASESTTSQPEVRHFESIPGLSVIIVTRLDRPPDGRRSYLFDYGSKEAARFSAYTMGPELVFSVTDVHGESFQVIVPLSEVPQSLEALMHGQPYEHGGVPLRLILCLDFEFGSTDQKTEMRILVNGKEVASLVKPFHVEAGPIFARRPKRIGSQVLGADLDKKNGGIFDCFGMGMWSRTLTSDESERMAQFYLQPENIDNRSFVKFSGTQWGANDVNDTDTNLHLSTNQLWSKIGPQQKEAPSGNIGTQESAPASVVTEAQRLEFLQRRGDAIRSVRFFIELDRRYTVEEVGHFGIIFEAISREQGSPALMLSAQDSPLIWHHGTEAKPMLGTLHIAWTIGPDEQLQQTIIRNTEIDKIGSLESSAAGIFGGNQAYENDFLTSSVQAFRAL